MNWAFQSHREEMTNHFHLFVGDLASDVDDRVLYAAFSPYGKVSYVGSVGFYIAELRRDARVMWDTVTGRSRGYGFVAFATHEEAERALFSLNGQPLGSRVIRVNWANQRTAVFHSATSPRSDNAPLITTVYVGNIGSEVTESVLRSQFMLFGSIEDIRIHHDKGYAFVRCIQNS